MASRRGPVLSAIAIAIALPACGAGDDETSPSEPATTTSSPRATSTASTLPASTLPEVTPTDPASSTTAPPPVPPSIDLGAPAWSAVYGFGGVWIQVDPPVDQIVKVDEASGAVTLTIDAGTGAAITDDAVWVTVGGTETRKIDPVTGEVLLAAATPDAYYLTVGAGGVWVPSTEGVTRLDPATGAITATISLDLDVADLEASDDAVWITHKDDGMVSRIDPATNTVVATIETGAGAHDLAIDEHGVWITNYRANTVSRIDPATNTVVATVEGVGSGVGITAGDGGIFVGTRDGDISRIDPATNAARPVADLDGWPYGLAYGNGELWAANADTGVVYRLDNALLDPVSG